MALGAQEVESGGVEKTNNPTFDTTLFISEVFMPTTLDGEGKPSVVLAPRIELQVGGGVLLVTARGP
jgi:hypothetical protein